MHRLFVGNFDFEWTLARTPGCRPPAALERTVSELAFAWLAIAEPDDWIYSPGYVSPDDWAELQAGFPRPLPRLVQQLAAAPPGLELVPWGWTAEIEAAWARLQRSLPPRPALEAVRLVNSRSFSTQLERGLGFAPEWLAYVTTFRELQEQLSRFTAAEGGDAEWLLKANLAGAGRERCRGRGTTIDDRTAVWIARQFESGGGVAFEPWLEVRYEAGLLWNVPRCGPPELLGIAPLLTDAGGRYRGSLLLDEAPLESLWNTAINAGFEAATAVQTAGYFGPLGIDACHYRDRSGRICCRPLQDLNARWTMGWLSLGWRSLLDPGDGGMWRQGGASAVSSARSGVERIRVTPRALDGREFRIPQEVRIHRGLLGSE